MLEWRREVLVLHSPVGELKESILLLTAVSVLKEFPELPDLRGNVRPSSRTVDELKGPIEVVQRQLGSATQFCGDFKELSASICGSTQEESPSFIKMDDFAECSKPLRWRCHSRRVRDSVESER